MKQIIVFVLATVSIGITACETANTKEAKETPLTAEPVKAKNFSDVVFATEKDTSCGMSLKYGIEDTLHFDGKVYGFCSKGCKDAFVEKLKAEKKL